MSPGREWKVRLSETADAEFRGILRWTAERFGARQASVYAETLTAAFAALAGGPMQLGARPRPEIGQGLFTLHVARGGRKGRHFILFRIDDSDGRRIIDVLRLLHDSLDLARHAPQED